MCHLSLDGSMVEFGIDPGGADCGGRRAAARILLSDVNSVSFNTACRRTEFQRD